MNKMLYLKNSVKKTVLLPFSAKDGVKAVKVPLNLQKLLQTYVTAVRQIFITFMKTAFLLTGRLKKLLQKSIMPVLLSFRVLP